MIMPLGFSSSLLAFFFFFLSSCFLYFAHSFAFRANLTYFRTMLYASTVLFIFMLSFSAAFTNYCLCFGFFMIANLLDNRMYFIFVHLCLCLVFFRLHGFPFLALMSVIKISYFNASLSSLNSTA
ncbi:hypothetical protein AB4K20DRAFT_1888011 [Rhizopus microsporus]